MNADLSFLFQDDDLLAVNKPAGLLTIPDGYDSTLPNLSALLKAQFGKVWTVHRLDKDTSGVILFALNADAHRALNMQFEQRAVRKEYHALVMGAPDWQTKEITLPLRVNVDRKHRTHADPQRGKPAATTIHCLQRFHLTMGDAALVSALPHSGYTHQIRAHLVAVGLPLFADALYLPPPPYQPLSLPALPIQRTALHAWQITFTHPTSGDPLTLHSPYPPDFAAALEYLYQQSM